MAQGLYAWSKTAATNANSDSTINWAEGQAPSSVNDSARAVMARVAEARDDWAGSITTAGTSTAYMATTNQVFASLALMDKQTITIIPHATSGASPTLAVDGLAAKALRCATGATLTAGAFLIGTPYRVTYYNGVGEFIADGAGIADGAISTANIAALAVTAAKIANNTITATQLAAGSVGAAAVASSFVPLNTVMLNGTIVQSQAANAQTFAIKTLAGADPSASDPTTILFRDVTAATGDYLVRTVTAALSITIPSGQAMGFTNATPARVWLGALDNAGAVELFVVNALSGTTAAGLAIYPLQGWGIISTSAVSGASAAGVAYSTTSRSSKAYVPLGFAAWETGGTLGTAGTWNVAPTRLQIYQPGVSPLPGQEIQRTRTTNGTVATGGTAFASADSVPQNTAGDQYFSLAVTPVSSANMLEIEAQIIFCGGTGANNRIGMALFQDVTASALTSSQFISVSAQVAQTTRLYHEMLSATVSSTTMKIRMGQTAASTNTVNGENSARLNGGNFNSFLRIREIMA